MHRMHGASGAGGGVGEASEYNPIDDFDLFWGMGPSRRNSNTEQRHEVSHQHQQQQQQSQRQLQVDVIGSASAVGNSMVATPSRNASNGAGGGGGGGGLNSSGGGLTSGSLGMGGGGLWSHGTLEAYGHRHHVHAQADAGMKDPGVVRGGTSGSVLASSTGPPVPASHRAVWPSPSPSSSSRNSSPLMQQHHRPGTLDMVGSQSLNNVNLGSVAGVGKRLTASTAMPAAGSDHAGGNIGSSSTVSIVDSKLEELAAAITSSVMGKLDGGVRESVLSQRPHQQHGGAPQPNPSSYDASAEAAAVVAPLRSRLMALEEQVAELKVALERKPTRSPSRSRRSSDESGLISGENEPPPAPLASRGQGSSAGRGGRGGGNGGSGIDRDALEQSVSALAQRTGTLEGRHKQVQAKVALLDSAFGSKASDWAHTVREIIIERELAAASADIGGQGSRSASGGRNTGKGSKKFSGYATTVNATNGSSSHASHVDDRGNRFGGNGVGGKNGSKNGAGAKDSAAARTLGCAHNPGTDNNAVARRQAQSNEESSPHPPPELTETTGRYLGSNRASKPVAGNISADQGASRTRCAACLETGERCSRLEARVLESELALSLLKKQTAEATNEAKAALAVATTAEAGRSKAMEAVSSSEASAAAAEKAAAETASTVAEMASSRRESAAAMTDVGSGAGGGKQQQKAAGSAAAASANLKAIVDKLVGDVKQLSDRTKEGEDVIALVEHGLKGVRDEITPLSGSCAAVTRLAELRSKEKEQASEMLKGYVTTITREVATITRQYINDLLDPGRVPAAAIASANDIPVGAVNSTVVESIGGDVHNSPDAASGCGALKGGSGNCNASHSGGDGVLGASETH